MALGAITWSSAAMKMSIFVFALGVALAAGSAYSEMNATNDPSVSISSTSDVSVDRHNQGSDGSLAEHNDKSVAPLNQ